jgi:hypothetical protein
MLFSKKAPYRSRHAGNDGVVRKMNGVMEYSNIPVSTVSKPPGERFAPFVKGAFGQVLKPHTTRYNTR